MKANKKQQLHKTKLHKGDLVRVIAGKHKGLESPILRLDHAKSKVFLEGVTVIKHVKPDQNQEQGGIQDVPYGIHWSNVMILDPKNKKKVSRIAYKTIDNKKVRIAVNSKAKLG